MTVEGSYYLAGFISNLTQCEIYIIQNTRWFPVGLKSAKHLISSTVKTDHYCLTESGKCETITKDVFKEPRDVLAPEKWPVSSFTIGNWPAT